MRYSNVHNGVKLLHVIVKIGIPVVLAAKG